MRIHLTAPQAQIWQSDARFICLVAGRRFGKTMLALLWLLDKASRADGTSINYYIAPSYVMAKQIAWRQLKEIIGNHARKINEAELYVELENGAIVQLKGADNPDSLRGVSLSSCVLDEAAFMQKDVWAYAIRPATSDKQAPVLFISTPSGWNWFKTDIYDRALDPDTDNWEAFTFTTAEGGNVPVEEIEQARQELDPKTFRQEYLASFETLDSQVYSNFDIEQNTFTQMPDISEYPSLHIGIDFNVGVMSAVVGLKVADQLHIIDELAMKNSNTTELAREIKARYPDHTIYAYPDPSGRSRKTSAIGGVTDFTILQNAGFYTIAPAKHPAISDRINTVQTLLCNADGYRRLHIHKDCSNLIRSFQGLTYDPVTQQPDKKSGLDHHGDSIGYLIVQLFPFGSQVEKIKISGF